MLVLQKRMRDTSDDPNITHEWTMCQDTFADVENDGEEKLSEVKNSLNEWLMLQILMDLFSDQQLPWNMVQSQFNIKKMDSIITKVNINKYIKIILNM